MFLSGHKFTTVQLRKLDNNNNNNNNNNNKPDNRNTTHLEGKNKSDTSNNRSDWDLFQNHSENT